MASLHLRWSSDNYQSTNTDDTYQVAALYVTTVFSAVQMKDREG